MFSRSRTATIARRRVAEIRRSVVDESVDDSAPLVIFDPDATWKKKEVYDFTAKELQVPVFQSYGHQLVYAAKYRFAAGGDKAFAYAEAGD